MAWPKIPVGERRGHPRLSIDPVFSYVDRHGVPSTPRDDRFLNLVCGDVLERSLLHLAAFAWPKDLGRLIAGGF